VDLENLVNSMQVVELSATTRVEAIRELVAVGQWEQEKLSPDDVVQAVEEREATAQTVVAPGLALPHAVLQTWRGYRVVLGRSREGVSFGPPAGPVHVIVLLIVGKDLEKSHLEVLAMLAELFNDESLRQSIVDTPDVESIGRLLRQRAGHPAHGRRWPPPTPRRSIALVRQAVQLVENLSAQALLLAVDRSDNLPWEPLLSWAGRLLVIATDHGDQQVYDRADTHLFEIPHGGLSRMDRANLGLLLAAAKGLVDHRSDVVCVTGQEGQPLDSIVVTAPAAHFRAVLADKNQRGGANIPPAVILRVLSLAIEIAAEGREAAHVGTMFVVGDTRQVMRRAQQLILNPFHGFSHRLRNVLDPSLTETVKEFALLDGAFIIHADGTALTAGTYLAPHSPVTDLLGGLGARHQTAAAITAETQAISITVSQSTGTVTLFQNGAAALTLERAALTRW
jgi:DNA integrity scanning protein DisA with diadenylate cyclase activity/mannitol/fructose-specific phosphotransferase system IIA component (Ntr-type)